MQVTFHDNIEHRAETRTLHNTGIDGLWKGQLIINFNNFGTVGQECNNPVHGIWGEVELLVKRVG